MGGLRSLLHHLLHKWCVSDILPYEIVVGRNIGLYFLIDWLGRAKYVFRVDDDGEIPVKAEYNIRILVNNLKETYRSLIGTTR
jgi:hypothetical protein